MTEAKENSSTVVVITGCSSGIGKALTLHLIQDPQYTVFATMRNPDSEKGKSLLDESMDAKATLQILPLDVTDTDACAKVLEKVTRLCGGVDILVNNAGYCVYGATECVTLDSIKKMFNTNVFGLIDMCKRVLPGMRKRRKGRIINISSVGGVFAQPFVEGYCASKFAVEGYTQSIARYCRNFGIHACTVCPGGVITDFGNNMHQPSMESTPDDYKELYGKAFEAYMKKNILSTQEVGAVVDVIVKAMTDKQPKIRYLTNPDIDYIFETTCGKNIDGEAAQAISDEKIFNNWK